MHNFSLRVFIHMSAPSERISFPHRFNTSVNHVPDMPPIADRGH